MHSSSNLAPSRAALVGGLLVVSAVAETCLQTSVSVTSLLLLLLLLLPLLYVSLCVATRQWISDEGV